MKKITLALALILAIGLVAASAQELTATVSGSATATVGFDLDATAFGIVNSATSDVSLTLASGDASTEMADGWYGYVSLTKMKLALDYASGADFATAVAVAGDDTDLDADSLPDDNIELTTTTADSGLIVTAPTVTAQITNGTTYFQIWALDGFSVDVAAPVEDDKSDISVEGKDGDIGVDLGNGSGGFTFGTVAGPATIKVHFATETGYDGEDSADNANFYIGSDISLTAGPADIGLQVVKGIGVADDGFGVGITTGLGVGPLDVDLAVDLDLDGGFSYEARLDTGITMGDIGAKLALFYGASNVDVEISSSPSFGDIGLSVLIGLYDLTTTLAWGIDLGATYALNDMVKLALDVAFDSATVVPLAITATITEPIPNVVMTAKYASSDVANGVLGDITFATKISY